MKRTRRDIIKSAAVGMEQQETGTTDLRAYGGFYGQSSYGVSRERIHHRSTGYSMIMNLRLVAGGERLVDFPAVKKHQHQHDMRARARGVEFDRAAHGARGERGGVERCVAGIGEGESHEALRCGLEHRFRGEPGAHRRVAGEGG